MIYLSRAILALFITFLIMIVTTFVAIFGAASVLLLAAHDCMDGIHLDLVELWDELLDAFDRVGRK